VLIAGFPAGSFAANCYVAAVADGEECVIIDPGEDAATGIEEIVAEHRLKPSAVLLTHGHLDHVWSVAPVCGARNIPAFIHPADRELLTDPAKGFGLGVGQQLFGGLELTEPDDVRELADGLTLELAGLSFVVDHRPGHTRGSVTFLAPGEPAGDPSDTVDRTAGVLFSGDLLFAGSIGRTDLPGGDSAAMGVSLGRTMSLPDETIVLAGHGPRTTIGAERHSNPFLTGISAANRGL
jgi:hydroxyacylglutathione hydrolase